MSKVLNGEMASDQRPRPIDWLWPGRVARGKLTVIAGDPGLGKSQLACALAAAVSTGGPWPFGEGRAPMGEALMFNGEDDPCDTIVPRLIAAGARLDRVSLLDGTVTLRGGARRTMSLKADIDVLEEQVLSHASVGLMVVDPVSAFLGSDVDSHRQSDVRGLLAPLAELASRRRVAIVLVAHLNKGAGADAMARVAGSGAFVAASRSTLLVARDAADPERRLLLPAKNNLARDVGGLAFTVEGVEIACEGAPIATSRIVWTGQTDITANEALRALADGGESDEEGSALEDAKWFLRQVLARGPVPPGKIRQQAKDAAFGWMTVRRAKEAMGVRSVKPNEHGPWLWDLEHEHEQVVAHAHAHHDQGAHRSVTGNDEHLGPEPPPYWDDDIPTAEVGP